MKKNYNNKAMSEEQVEVKTPTQSQVYTFPEYGISIRAGSLKEAREKLKAQLKNEVKND